MRIKQIFIAGGCGFIGANLVKYVLDKGRYNISVYDNLSCGSKANLNRAIKDSKQKGKVEFIKGDILNFAKLNKVIKGHNIVIHLAAHTRVIESLKNPIENFTINSIGTFNILEAARRNRIRKIVFASSNAAVGEQIPPINEKMIPRPISPYGANKLYGEALCSAYFHSYGLKTVSLRFANAYGLYSEHKSSVIVKFIRRTKQGKLLEIYGDGNQTRDFIHAKDICQAIYLVFNHNFSKPAPWGQVFQIATGKETKIIDLARMISNFVGRKKKNILFTSQRKGEIKKNFSDITKAKKQLLFIPKIRLSNGLKEMWNMEK